MPPIPGSLADGQITDTSLHAIYTIPADTYGVGLKLLISNIDASDLTVAKISVTRDGSSARRYATVELEAAGGSARIFIGDLSEGDAVNIQLTIAADVDYTLTGGVSN